MADGWAERVFLLVCLCSLDCHTVCSSLCWLLSPQPPPKLSPPEPALVFFIPGLDVCAFWLLLVLSGSSPTTMLDCFHVYHI